MSIRKTGIVFQRFGKQFKVFVENQTLVAFAQKKLQWKRDFKLLVGDKVTLENGVIVAVDERKNTLVRPKVVNVDQVVIVQSLIEPKINWQQLFKLLIHFHAQNVARLVLVITKNDLEFEPAEKARLSELTSFGYQLFFTAPNADLPLTLFTELQNRFSVFMGQSGVGKSSLINRLDSQIHQAIQALSAHQFGKNTTTSTVMFPFQNGFICDTPGFNVIDFPNLKQLAAQHFVGFASLIGQCHFSNCTHQSEKGCFIVSAVTQKSYSLWLYESYLKLIN
ncbi:ribosome small subunit-dependent GTPase A [Mycoplasmoides pneumoniae]|uniref:ribosome small subunit-dependent GTPase A n=1 Tax=Mycoplasmoides pneumoniae TaxID=2104 RepID=UPI00071BF189|nr:ribosome small subunit-dependent GTPase A [Mycoplasmoides pneumoniae]